MEVPGSDDRKPLQNSRSALRIGLNEDPSPFSEILPDSVDTVGDHGENPPPPAGGPGRIPVDFQEFVCGACGEQKIKEQFVICDVCEGSFDLGCAEMCRWEAELLDEWVCGKCSFEEARSEELEDLRGHGEVNPNGARNKRMKMAQDGNLRPWSDLPEALLDQITRHFGVVDYLMFGCVCKSWRSYTSAYKQEFLASQTPHILFLSPYARKSCYFYNPFEHKMYKALLPSLVGRFCAGITGGYLVMDNKKEKADKPLWLVNPITRHELYFPRSPHRLCRIFLASVSIPRGELMLIGISMFRSVLQFCRSSDVQWTTYEFQGHELPIDGAFFKGKLYLITDVGRILQFDPSSPPYYIKLGVGSIPNPTLQMRLVASEEQLFVLVTSYEEHHRIYMLDFQMKLWITVQSLGDQALFIGNRIGSLGSCTKVNSEEGCQSARDCILEVGYGCSEKFTVRPLGENIHWRTQIKINGWCGVPTSIDNAFWYFPHLASNVDSLSQ
ncbi:hypothetical protein L6164_005891 [Bauhinia variegata]|uniref:Uncharacterized protein n=1 Tax=Bauhinia variegata TaxID=167791 RepID=A0ACB9PSN6_BAUVA|nr:hypothetical protein L6164_005891 [Bauhinia variegata]